MNSSKKIQQCYKLYKDRLQNLSQVINQLHTIIKNDQILNNLKDSSLQKYKIDRINELILQILNSQKQKMLIRVLDKYQQLSNKFKQKQNTIILSNKQLDHNIKYQYQNEINNLKNICKQQDQIIKFNKIQLFKFKEQIHHLENTNKSCPSCLTLNNNITDLQLQLDKSSKTHQKLKKQHQQSQLSSSKALQKLAQQNKSLSSSLKQRQLQISQLKMQQKSMVQNKKNLKLQSLKKQIIFLQQQLVQIQKYFNIIKNYILEFNKNQIKKIKNYFLKLQNQCKYSLDNYKQQTLQIIQQITYKLQQQPELPSQQLLPSQQFYSKLNQLDNQLHYFIQNQLISE